jgi:hypothetical protein
VLIEWFDSTGAGREWDALPGEEPEPILIHSVGWLVAGGDKSKVIVPHLHGADTRLGVRESGCGGMTIPTCAVKRMVTLQEPAA